MYFTIISLVFAVVLSAADGPCTTEGYPDFSGMYDIGSLTPLQRPVEFGSRLELTDAEADAIAKRGAATTAAGNRATDPNRKAPAEGGDVGSYNQLWYDRG